MAAHWLRSTPVYTAAGQLLCPRCGKVASGWPLQRPDNCGLQGPHSTTCLRWPADILATLTPAQAA